MSDKSELDQKIITLGEEAIREQVFPGCQVGYIQDGRATILPIGRLTYEKTSSQVTSQTIYDVASITKSVTTGSVILKLIEDGRLSLDDKAITYIPELQNDFRDQILVRNLLTYTVVLDLPHGLAKIAKENPDKITDTLLSTPLKAPPGGLYYYTNPPAIFLGMIAERICGKELANIAKEMFYDNCGMNETTFSPTSLGKEIAPTALDERGLVQGMPHDETAWAMRKRGVNMGHAGLFSTTRDLLKFAQMILNQGQFEGTRYFEPQTIKQMHTNQIDHLPAHTGLGWELDLGPMPQRTMGHETFGKTGFTGCAMIMDPFESRALVYLSNRTFPQRPNSRDAIQAFRKDLAKLVFG